MSVEDIVTYTFYWYSQSTACRQCAALNGAIIHDQTLDQPILYAMGQPVWDLQADRPLTHGGTGINCHCHLEVVAEVDLSKATWWQDLLNITRRLT